MGANELTQFLGIEPADFIIEPHYERLDYSDMLLLLCSDGLTCSVSEERIAQILGNPFDETMEQVSNRLVEQALKNGSKDNITAMVVKIKLKSIKGSEYAIAFIKEHQSKWDTYTDKEKLKLLNEYAVEIGKRMDNEKWYDFFTGHKIVTSVEYATTDPNYNPNDTSYGYTNGQGRTGIIYINDQYGNSDKPLFNLPFAVTTVTHEARHQYQGQAYYNPKRYKLPNYEQTEWFDRVKYPKRSYWIRPWEIDARAYSGLAN